MLSTLFFYFVNIIDCDTLLNVFITTYGGIQMKKKSKGQLQPDLCPKSAALNELIRKAALTLDPLARIKPLAEKAGLTSAAIRASIRRGYFTSGAACALELAVGRDLLTKEALCPHKFSK